MNGYVQGEGVAGPDGLFAHRVPGHDGDGKVHLGQTLAVWGDHHVILSLDDALAVLDSSISFLDTSIFVDESA